MQYDMVFEGGGAKGMVFVGALEELNKHGVEPARLMGTSAGSIMSTFLAAGYTTDEMAAALKEEKDGKPVFMGFLQTPQPLSREEMKDSAIRELLREVNLKFIPDNIEEAIDDGIAAAIGGSAFAARLVSFIERGGFFAADTFIDWLRGKLNTGSYNLDRGAHPKGSQRAFGDMTMAQFHEAVGIDLSLVAADTTGSQMLILNHRTAPGLPLVWGVRMSMSVPLLWQEVVWKPEWGAYRGKNINGHAVVDGGLLSNFPIELFISSQSYVTDVMGEKTTLDMNVLGFLIDESLEVPGAPSASGETKSAFDFGRLRTVQRIQNLMNTLLSAHDKVVMDAFENLVIRLPAKGYGTIEFDMSEARRNALVDAGRTAAAAYFARQSAAAPDGVMMAAPAPPDPLSAADKMAEKMLR